MLSYVILHYFNTDEVTIGSRNSTICLNGLNILERHATIRCIDAYKYELIAADPGAKIKVNGYNLKGYIPRTNQFVINRLFYTIIDRLNCVIKIVFYLVQVMFMYT